jgi:hypothetical protein
MIPHSTSPDAQTLPLEVRVRHLTLSELYRAADSLSREAKVRSEAASWYAARASESRR